MIGGEWLRSRVWRLLCALLLVLLAVVAPAGGTAALEPDEEQVEEPREDPAAPGGIKVHGHWTIEVYEPDGALVSHDEFENALVPGGARFIARALAGLTTPGSWTIGLFGDPSNQSTFPHPCSGGGCNITEPAVPFTSSSYFRNLSKEVPGEGEQAGKLVLSGSVTPTTAAEILLVVTYLSECTPDTAPGSCIRTGGASTITQKTLSPGVPVAPGQIVQVRVVISFE